MKSTLSKYIASLIILLTAWVPHLAYGAYCALRDPVETINQLYPDYKSYRSIVRVIDQDIRASVTEKMPHNTLHFSELGRHTLYVVFDQSAAPLGYVHVRSEESDWGLVEAAWAIDLEMKIADFRFQRCRSMEKKTLERADFKSQIIGKDFYSLSPLLSEDGNSINKANLKVDDRATSLAAAVVKSGLKTLLVTQLAWQKEIEQYRFWQSANDYFHDMQQIKIVASPVNNHVIKELDTAFDGISPGIDRDTVTIAKVISKQGHIIGALYKGQFHDGQQQHSLEWAIAPDNTVVGVRNQTGWQSDLDKQVFEKVIGQKFNSAQQCDDVAELMTLEAIITSKTALMQ